MDLRAVLFDFSDTLFHIRSTERILDLINQKVDPTGPEAGTDTVSRADVESVLAEVRTRSKSPEELAKGRDRSPQAHRRCWTELYRPFDRFSPDLAERIYADISSPESWSPYPETVEVINQLHWRGVPIGVVSDIGWDIRSVFQRFELRPHIGAWVLSYEHGLEKPDPRLFNAGCTELGSAPAETLMVGDSVHRDGGGAAAGLTALTLPPYQGSGERGLRVVLDML